MKRILLAMFLMLPAVANAEVCFKEVYATWGMPTTYEDGTPLPPEEIAGYYAQWGTETGVYNHDQQVAGANTLRVDVWRDGIEHGDTVFFTVATVSTAGLMSLMSPEATCKFNGRKKPRPPSDVRLENP